MDALKVSIDSEKISFSTVQEQIREGAQKAFKESSNVEIPIQANIKVLTNDQKQINDNLALIQAATEFGITKFRWKKHLIPFDASLDPEQMKIAIKQATILQAEFNQILESSIQNGVSTLAEGIGDALATGDWGSMFQGMKVAIGGAMQDFGKFLIKSAITIEVAKKAAAWAVAHPAAAVAAGAALVALGAVLKANVNKRSQQPITGFAHGGGVSGPGMAIVGEQAVPAKTTPNYGAALTSLKACLAALLTIMQSALKT
ncbi:hypothetical protein LWM68_40975 [Niabella sp. W65]|nr:hypothetical protein [Niabella sp. W65]MCH7368547.1 hypothetical protein [Niabella sp. W65]